MRYQDVAIHTNTGIFGGGELLERCPPLNVRIALSDEMWIGKLEPELATAVMDTCESKVVGVEPPVRQFAQLYAFVRDIQGPAEIYGWDESNELASAIGLSRLIHPTTAGFGYAARIGCESGVAKQVFPAQIIGLGKEAFLSPNRKRDWLTNEDAMSLRELVPRLRRQLPRRIHNALWHHEYAMRTYYLDHRWTLICTGLESFVHTQHRGSTQQFKCITRLATEVGVSISEDEAGEAYDLRSQLAHGTSFISAGSKSGPTALQFDLYDRLEETLRRAVHKGMTDDAFANTFETDEQIRAKWPLPKG